MRNARVVARVCLALCVVTSAGATHADAVEDFYKGKTITMIIGLGAGGGYDLSARLVAQHLGDFIPGRPTIGPRNMPSAGSIAAAEYVFNVAPKDGTVLAMFQPTFVLEKVTDRARRYDPQRFSYVGRVDQSVLVGLVWHTSPARTIDEAKRAEVVLSANAAAGTSATIPWALNRLIGTKFKVVLGYESSAGMGLAMERGEAFGNGSTSWDYLETKPDWLEQKKVNFLYTIALERFAKLPDVPTVLELATNDRDRNILKLMASTSSIGRAILSAPDIPGERLDALRRAFDEMVKDPKFLADAARRRLGVDPASGAALERMVTDVASQPDEVVEAMKRAVAPP